MTLQVYGNGKLGLPTKSSGLAQVLVNVFIHSVDIWNLEFFELLLPYFCAFKHDSSIIYILAEYTPAVYVLFLCLVFFFILPWICHACARSHLPIVRDCILKIERAFIRLRYRWSIKSSVIHSLTTFLVLSYARVTLTTFKLLAPVSLYGPGGQYSLYTKRVVWYDGTMSYFGHEHFPYAVIALLVLVTFVVIPPLLLLSYPLLPVVMTRLGLEDYWIVKKLIINPLSKCVPIFDAFQSCYKDKYRFFAGLLFVYRVTALAIYGFPPTTAIINVCIQLFLLSVLLLHCVCQPYKKRWHNFIEACTLALLTSISVISSHRLFEAETSQTQTDVFFWIQTVLLYCPLVYFTGYVTYNVIRWLYRRITTCNKTNYIQNNNNLLNSCEFPARMEEDDDNYSTTSESTSESTVPNDVQHSQGDDDDVEMIYPIQWNDDDDIRCQQIPYHSLHSGRNRITQ